MPDAPTEGWVPPGGKWRRLTIDDAELAGWMWLKITCRCGIVCMPWRLLRKRSRYRRLGEITERLRCELCGRPPESVALYWQGGRDKRETALEG